MKSLLPFKLVYHDRYDLNLGPHVFPSQKFRLIYEMLLRESLATEADFLRPNPASDEDILRVHTADWVRKLKTGTLTASDVMRLEVPYSPELVEAVWLAASGRRDQESHRGGYRRAPRQRHSRNFSRRPDGFHTLNPSAQQLSRTQAAFKPRPQHGRSRRRR